jgi:hemerythrin superfamily protein
MIALPHQEQLSLFSGASADKDVIELLSKEHREALDKLQQLYVTVEPDMKRKLANILITDLVVHDVTEETIVYPFLADKIPDGIDVKKINADEHEEMEQTLRDLESADCEKPEPFYAIVKGLTAVLDRHRCDTTASRSSRAFVRHRRTHELIKVV